MGSGIFFIFVHNETLEEMFCEICQTSRPICQTSRPICQTSRPICRSLDWWALQFRSQESVNCSAADPARRLTGLKRISEKQFFGYGVEGRTWTSPPKKSKQFGHQECHSSGTHFGGRIPRDSILSVKMDCESPNSSARNLASTCFGTFRSGVRKVVVVVRKWCYILGVLRLLRTKIQTVSRDMVSGGGILRMIGTTTISPHSLRARDFEPNPWVLRQNCRSPRVVVVPRTKFVVETTPTTWNSLPDDVQAQVLRRLEFRDLFRFKALSKAGAKVVVDEVDRRTKEVASEGMFTALSFYIKKEVWRCSGFDLQSNSWRELPPLSYLPAPDTDLFKEYSVCGDGGLMCAEVSKLPKKGELVVFNPLTGQTRALPPLIHPRKPVLVHLAVDSATKRYKVIVAGSAAANDEHLSKKVEVYDSLTCKWTEVCDLPGPVFGLNEHQAGVCLNGVLFFIAFREDDYRRGVVAFDVENEQWLENLACPIPWSPSSNTLQLVENDGQLYLFSEQERGATVEHCIDELELPNADGGDGGCRWRNVVRAKKSGGRGLLVYPEYTCVSFGKRKLCIFNTLSRDGGVYDVRDGQKCEPGLGPPPANQTGDTFFTMNPATFAIQPNFGIEC